MALKKFYLLSFGCAKNLVDTEKIAGALCHQGYVPTAKLADADLVIINTCAFLKTARRESLQGISRITRQKKKMKGSLPKIIVVGCLARYYNEDKIKFLLPEVDRVFSPGEYHSIVSYLHSAIQPLGKSPSRYHQAGDQRLITSSPHSVYLKIADGCDNRCSYCLIPSLRGPLRSRKMEDILTEARVLLGLGAREINLVAQDTTAYGLDLYGKKMLGTLLQQLGKIKGLAWIRIMYTHPAHIEEDLLKIIAAEPRVCKYIDLPLQHVSNPILQHMGRGTTREQISALYEKIRRTIPGVVLRTTVMVGYPVEGEKEFTELLRFLREYPFERLGAFIYSRERGTLAFTERQHVPSDLAKARYEQVMEQQAPISRSFNRKLMGKRCTVLVDATIRKGNKFIGRLPTQAPEVDGKVFASGRGIYGAGEFIKVRITGTGNHDLLATGEED
ncbi:MAG: 30S ribosomal protein S12 methylthiotransferase RimO [Bacillota bacterium]